MTADPPAPIAGTRLRADARRNRDQLIDAARSLFAEQGTGVPMEEIARRAGVGVGTLYRRFADREALIRALAIDTFTHLVDDARTAEAEEPDARRALGRLLRRSVNLRLIMRIAMFSPDASQLIYASSEISQLRVTLLEVIDRLVTQAKAEGSVRQDVGAGDVTVLLAMVVREVPTVSAHTADLLFERCVCLVLDGLGADPGTPLPGRPLAIPDVSPWAV